MLTAAPSSHPPYSMLRKSENCFDGCLVHRHWRKGVCATIFVGDSSFEQQYLNVIVTIDYLLLKY